MPSKRSSRTEAQALPQTEVRVFLASKIVLQYPRISIALALPSDEIDLRHIDLKAHTGIVVRLEMEDHEEKGHH